MYCWICSQLNMRTSNNYFRIFFVVFATSGTVMLWFLHELFPQVINYSHDTDDMSSSMNLTTDVFTSHMRAILDSKTVYSIENNDALKHSQVAPSNQTVEGTGQSNTTDDVKAHYKQSPYIDPKLYIDQIKDYKTILWWNVPGWLIEWQNKADMTQCHYKNCRVSYDKKDFNKSNAVVFSISDRGISHKPPVPMDKRNPDQAWVFFTLESPVHAKRTSTAFLSPHWHNAFNWSWNYRPDSDIFSPYGWLHSKEVRPARNYSEIFKKKSKTIAWLVSHCNSVGRRDDYVRILNKYIPVDIYGNCGKQVPANIEEIISNHYKFYLGFENSLCYNYMTEKFFHYYKMDTITVLRGKTNYSDFLPAHSFIDTADFASIKALGEFLKDLSENEEEYIKYMKIKDMYKVTERDEVYKSAVCNLCDKLNNLDKNRKVYKKVGDWVGTCDKANDLNET